MKRLIALTAAVASAAILYGDGFEPPLYNGTSAGIVLSGQQGWINPTPGLPDFRVYDYPANALGFASNPLGQGQFIAGICGANQAYARTQKANAFGTADVWTISYMMNAKYNGVPPASNNISKLSLQPSETAGTFNATAQWPNPQTPTQWHYGYEVADALGVLNGTNVYPNTQWRFLPTNRWFRFSTTFDVDSREILYTTMTNIGTGVTYAEQPVAWFLSSGSTPSAIRLFVGGTTAGNAIAIDHLNVRAGAVVTPDSVTAVRGAAVASGVIRTIESDNVRLHYKPGVVLVSSQEPIQLLVRARAHETGPASMTLRIESAASATAIRQTVALWNFQTGAYESIDARQLTTADNTITLSIPTNAARFVEPFGTREVRLLLGYKPSGPVLSFPWSAYVDNVLLTF
ncbi:MAG: hypothetical protein M3R13_10330 [Armatimonadota bacterium]|nr:hypothetical protein [Armatimonadota bacterium]